MADVSLFGLDPGRHHLVNVFFHLLNTLMLFFVLSRMTRDVWRCAFVAALFGFHPLHVESVAWVAERKDVLSGFFFMLTLWSYLRYVERPGWWRNAVVLLFSALGLMSKPSLVTLPFVLLLLDWWPLGRMPFVPLRRLLAEKAPLFFLSAAVCAVSLTAQEGAGATDIRGDYPMTYRVANALISYGTYLAKTFWPSSLSVYYPHSAAGIPSWTLVAAGLTVACITFVCIRFMRRFPYLPAGWFWYVGTLVPMIGLVPVGDQAMADRYTYLPLIGIFVMIAWGAPDLAARWHIPAKALAVTGGSILVALSVVTWLHLHHWRGSDALYEHALRVTADNWMMHNNLGVVRYQQGRKMDAIRHYEESVRIRPGFGYANHNLGETLLEVGQVDRSVYFLRKAVALLPASAFSRLSLGKALSAQGKRDEALSCLLEARRLAPDNQEILLELMRLRGAR